MKIVTNRDLYLAIGELQERHKAGERSLERYLLALLGLARRNRRQTHLSLAEFYHLLSNAFTAEPIPFEAAWRDKPRTSAAGLTGFDQWEAVVLLQIVDLREMDEAGTLADEHRYFGVNSPRGGRWYNFDPTIYLECAMAGSLGGWEPGDPTGRQLVPGEVAVFDAEGGGVQFVDSQDIERPVVETPELSWEELTDFVECGQMYE